MKSKLNREWHEKNRMPKNPNEGDRAKWHKEHMKYCACRAPSAKILALIKKYGKSSIFTGDSRV